MKWLNLLIAGTLIMAGPAGLMAADFYVTIDGSGDGSSWEQATGDLQGAIDAAQAGDTVWVGPGTYATGGKVANSMTNRIAIEKAITVRSANNDPLNTIIEGAFADDGNTNGPSAIRCVYMKNGATLIGFTLRNGAALAAGATAIKSGGGVCCAAAADEVSNCIITDNAAIYGGGAAFGTFKNCLIINNVSLGGSSEGGGGAYSATLSDCLISNNFSTGRGGGVFACDLSNCQLIDNAATSGGGAANKGTLSNCVIAGNSASTGSGGGVYQHTGLTLAMYNCLIIGNSVESGNNGGGGVYGGNLYNCTIAGNYAPYNGGGVRGSKLWNSIVYYNDGANPNYLSSGITFTNCCTTPAVSGWAAGNITDEPGFLNKGSGYGTAHVHGDYRLSRQSPCIDAGLNQDWMEDARDLAGETRIYPAAGTVDMGAFEYTVYKGALFLLR